MISVTKLPHVKSALSLAICSGLKFKHLDPYFISSRYVCVHELYKSC